MSKSDLLIFLLEKIWEKAQQEAERIREEAKVKAKEILEEAKKRAETVKIERETEIRLRIRRRLYREYALKKLELRRYFILEKNKALKELLERAIKIAYDLAEKRDSKYLEALKKLAINAVSRVGSEKVILYCCSEEDKAYLKEVIREISDVVSQRRKVEIIVADKVLNCNGGVIAVSADGRIIYNNTLNARIKRVETELLPALLSKL